MNRRSFIAGLLASPLLPAASVAAESYGAVAPVQGMKVYGPMKTREMVRIDIPSIYGTIIDVDQFVVTH